MKKFTLIMVVVGFMAFVGLGAWAGDVEIKQGDFVTVCKAGKACGKFEVAAKEAKDCKCGAVKDKMHVLKIDGDVAVLCQCGGMCACELHPKNPYLCGCGTPVKVVKLPVKK
jgi:hypothetical protein